MKNLIAILLLSCLPFSVAAHSKLASSAPSDGAVLNMTPEIVSLEYLKPIRLTLVRVTGSDGASETLDLKAYKGFQTSYELQTAISGDGEFSIEWRGLGKDGHALKGRISFQVQ